MTEKSVQVTDKSKPVLNEPIHVTDAEFDKVVQEHPYVIVDFWAEWCAPCRAIAPMIEDLAKQYAGRVTFVKVNTDENPRVPQQFMVMGIPTLLFFKGGKLVDQVVGAMPRAPFEERVKKHLTGRHLEIRRGSFAGPTTMGSLIELLANKKKAAEPVP